MIYIQQLDETDCGAACIAMIASHFKVQKSITYIREISGTDTKGTNLAGLINGAEKLGFSAHALKGTKESLSHELPFPFIAHISVQQNECYLLHYVVIKSIHNNKIEIWDPDEAKKKYIMLIDDFCKIWSGYAIFISPRQNILIKQKDTSFLWRFFTVLKSYKHLIILLCITSLLLTAFCIISTLYTRYVIDDIIPSKTKITLTTFSIGVLLVAVMQAIMGIIRKKLLIHFSFKLNLNLIFSYFTHIFHLPLRFFDTRKSGEIISRLQDIGKIQETLSQSTVTIIMDIFMIIFVGPFLFLTNRLLFFIVLITVPFSSTIIYFFSKIYKKQYKEFMSYAADVQSYLVDSINGAATIKAMNAEDYVLNCYEKFQMKMTNKGWNLAHLQSYQEMLAELVKQIGNILVFWVGSLYVLKGELSIGTLISFTALSSYFTEPLQRLINTQSKIQESMVAADRLGEILEIETEQNSEKELLYLQKLDGNIEISDVTFKYGTRNNILEKLNLTIKTGEQVAIVGPSGSGKTTFIKLLLKLYIPDEGHILISNKNIRDIDSICLRNRIGYVPQDINLFSGTIAENIALHKPNATFEEIVEVSHFVGIDKFIEKLPDSYGTVIGERGIDLSGGERQRIAIARAIINKPDILIFDEATSNLDFEAEELVKKVLRKFHEESITTIIIAHHISTIINSDRIFIMDKGKITRAGTPEELKEDNQYNKLFDSL